MSDSSPRKFNPQGRALPRGAALLASVFNRSRLRSAGGLAAALCFFCLPAAGIYNLKTNKEQSPDVSGRHWIFVAEGCHSCDELLSELSGFCSGKKPPAAEKLGFFVSGQSRQNMLGKLKNYQSGGYLIFSGSPGELYASYGVHGSPSLLKSPSKSAAAGKKNKIISGKAGILKALRKDRGLCPA